MSDICQEENTSDCDSSFGERLKAARKHHNISQIDLSKKIGIKQGFLSDVECGKKSLSLDKILSLTEALDINYHWLLTGEGEMMGEPVIDIKEEHEPPKTPKEQKLHDIYCKLSDKGIQSLLDYAQYLLLEEAKEEDPPKENKATGTDPPFN